MSKAQVRLRPITEADLPDYVRWFNDAEATQFVVREVGELDMEKEREWFARISAPDDQDRHFAIEAEGRHIGNCALCPRPEQGGRSANFGIFIGDKTAWGKGYGTAVVREVLRIGFDEMGLHRIELAAFGPNTRAIRCYQKCGFRHEGVKRQAFLKRGVWLDTVMMAILREDWEADRKAARAASGEVAIRSYRVSDHEQVVALWRSVGFDLGPGDTREALAYKIAFDRGPFLVAEADGRIVATALGSWDGRWAWISRLAVDPDVQRRGIGTLLMTEVEKRLTALGARRFLLATWQDNVAARTLYERLGYEAIEGVVFLRKRLGDREEERHGS